MEIIIVVAILGIVIAVGAPSFREFILGQRVKNATFDLNASLSYARSESIMRNASVTVTPVSAGNWGNGWSIAAGGTSLRSQPAYTGLDISGPDSVTFNSVGRVSGGAAVSFTVDDAEGLSSVSPRCIRLSLTGLPYSQEGACS